MTIIERHIIVPVVIEGTLGAHYNAICVPSIFFIARTQVHIVAIEVEIGGVRRKQGLNCGARGRVQKGIVEGNRRIDRSEEHTSELQSLMRSSYAAFCLKK